MAPNAPGPAPASTSRFENRSPIASPAAPAGQPAAGEQPPMLSGIYLRYRQQSPIVVIGPATGRHYKFSAAVPVLRVDSADAEDLLNQSFLERVL